LEPRQSAFISKDEIKAYLPEAAVSKSKGNREDELV
jgi:hypothetical protein